MTASCLQIILIFFLQEKSAGHLKKQFIEPTVFHDFPWVAVMERVQTETQTPTLHHAGFISFFCKGRSVCTGLW